MPTQGLSLAGFLDEAAAIQHLRFACKPADTSEAALRALWQRAAAQLGAPTPHAGQPDILPIPQPQATYVDQVRQAPWVERLLETEWAGAEFSLVEIAPLLAIQLSVDVARCEHHGRHANRPPTPEEICRLCLPTDLEAVVPQVVPATNASTPSSLLIKARTGNLRISAWGSFTDENGASIVGIALGVSPGLVHVVRYDGRYYLHNGYHRAVALMRGGATHVACLLRDAVSPQDAGIRDDGGTFTLAQLAGANPPTLAHYAEGRALAVSLRNTSRVIHLSWSEYIVPEADDGA